MFLKLRFSEKRFLIPSWGNPSRKLILLTWDTVLVLILELCHKSNLLEEIMSHNDNVCCYLTNTCHS